MTPIIRYSFRFIILILIQYILCQMTPLRGFVTPYIYFVFILWLPFTMKRSTMLLVSALYGLALGYLLVCPGIHAAACVLIAYLRPYVLSMLLVKDIKDLNFAEPSTNSLGFIPYLTYIVILIIIHHSYIVLLQWLSVGHLGYFIVKVLLTSLISVIIIIILEGILPRTLKTRASLK